MEICDRFYRDQVKTFIVQCTFIPLLNLVLLVMLYFNETSVVKLMHVKVEIASLSLDARIGMQALPHKRNSLPFLTAVHPHFDTVDSRCDIRPLRLSVQEYGDPCLQVDPQRLPLRRPG